MTPQEAIRILHPDTTFEALTEIEYYGGFNGQEAKINAVEEACRVACEALEKQIPELVNPSGDGYADGEMVYDLAECPSCGRETDDSDAHWGDSFCPHCGQALLWEDKE